MLARDRNCSRPLITSSFGVTLPKVRYFLGGDIAPRTWIRYIKFICTPTQKEFDKRSSGSQCIYCIYPLSTKITHYTSALFHLGDTLTAGQCIYLHPKNEIFPVWRITPGAGTSYNHHHAQVKQIQLESFLYFSLFFFHLTHFLYACWRRFKYIFRVDQAFLKFQVLTKFVFCWMLLSKL